MQADSAVVNTREIMVYSIRDIYNGVEASIFGEKDFQWINAGVLAVPLPILMDIRNNPDAIESMA